MATLWTIVFGALIALAVVVAGCALVAVVCGLVVFGVGFFTFIEPLADKFIDWAERLGEKWFLR